MFRKAFKFKMVCILVIAVFLLETAVYGIDLPQKSHLRVPLSGSNERMEQAGDSIAGANGSDEPANSTAVSSASLEIIKKQVADLFAIGLNRMDEDGFALHGTSIEAIQELLKSGRLPNEGRLPDQLHFWMLTAGTNEDLLEAAKSYAEWNSLKHYLSSKLPFEMDTRLFEGLSDYASNGVTDEDENREFVDICRKNGIKLERLNRWLNQVKLEKRKGVILLLSKDANRDFRVSKDDGESEGAGVIKVPGGLPLKYIIGVEPLGQYEWDILVSLTASSTVDPSTSSLDQLISTSNSARDKL